MKCLKPGFTMVELIFVIVILGILASFALPRLIATREDAEISAYAKNLSILLTDISAYFISQNGYKSDLTAMTSVTLINKSDFSAELPARGVGCLKIQLYNDDTKDSVTDEIIRAGTAEVLVINKNNVFCKQIQDSPMVANYIRMGRHIILGEPLSR